MRFSLKTAFLVLTVICIVLSYVAYRLSRQGYFVTGTNFVTNHVPIAAKLRSRIAELPDHKLTDEPQFELTKRLHAACYATVKNQRIKDQFFCRTKLSDGSETVVGFWIYEHGVTYVLYAWDTYPEVASGIADKRRKERVALFETYTEIISEMDQEIAFTQGVLSKRDSP